MPTPEELARINIDKQLEACGWTVQSHNEMNCQVMFTITDKIKKLFNAR